MSTLAAEVVALDQVLPHGNADRLEVACVRGWTCVVQKDRYKPGSRVVYIPIDSVLPEKLETFLFPPDSKITLSKSRVRSIKIRGALSQGMVVGVDDLDVLYPGIAKKPVGEDVTDLLGIVKYEPPVSETPVGLKTAFQAKANPRFHKYTDIQNYKHHPDIFSEGEEVYITEKLHGTSARYGILPTAQDKWWKKVLAFFRLLPKYEFCIGSRNVQMQGTLKRGFYEHNVYREIARQESIQSKLQPGECIYGEIVGEGIQKGYTYGYEKARGFYAYDVSVDGVYLDPVPFLDFCAKRGFYPVPKLFIGPFSKAAATVLREGDSTIGGQKVREGIVIKPLTDQLCYIGRRVLKYVNDEYLLSDQTEYH